MKIGLVSTPFFGVPPPKYGGLERVVYDLWQGLVRRGHKVICFSPNPTVIPKGGFHVSTGDALTTVGVDWVQSEKQMLEKCEPYLKDVDVVSEHNWFGHVYACKSRNPSLKCTHTHHGHVSYDWWGKSTPPFKLNFIGISKWMKQCYETGYEGRAPVKIASEYAYNGVDLDSYPYKKDKENRLMFLGRIDPIKAPHVAIEVAEKTETPIDIVGGTSFVADNNYVHEIETKCSQSKYANFVGEVDHQTKLKYLQNAKALIIPSQFGEPFGLVGCEANACGTPVICLNDGALGEIIENGVTGFVCDSIVEMVKKILELDTIDPRKCRMRVEKYFSKEVMAERYIKLYERIVSDDEW